LCKALALNDELQHALTKYDAIASGIPVRSEVNAGSAISFAVYDQEDDEAELESSQLARRCAAIYQLSMLIICILIRKYIDLTGCKCLINNRW
jgi:hypothetical protein